MEIDDFKYVFSSFCDKDKTWQYFAEFRDCLQETEQILDLKKLTAFTKTVQFLDKINLIGCNGKRIQNSDNDSIVNCPKDFNDVLLSILKLFCTKQMTLIFEIKDDSHNLNEVLSTFEIIVYLITICDGEIKNNNYFEVLISTICNFLEKFSSKLKDQYTVVNESELGPLYYSSLQFLVKILKCVPACNEREHLPDDLILRVIDSLPFPDNTTVKFFINNIFPSVIHISSLSLKEKIYTSMWNIICIHFDTCNEAHGSEAKSCAYNMLCCLSENIFNLKQNMEIPIHNEMVFWKIILSGVTSSLPFTRKKALNIFKRFLQWKNGIKNNNSSDDNSKSIGLQNEEDMKIWNDIVILFECLEEKQVHVIKPVLPKFTRILSLITKQDAASSNNENFDLASAWVMALLHRMLKHETKYVIRWALSTVLSLDYIKYPIHKYDSEMFIKVLIEAFNEQTLYSRNSEQDNYSLFLSSEKIAVFLKNYMCTLDFETSKVAFMRCLISNIAAQSWCVVALLHLTFALSQMENIPAWNQEDLLHIRKIILDCQRSQEPAFRTALECFILECCSLFLDWNNITFEDIADLLVIFKSSAILHNTRPWTKFAARFSDAFSKASSTMLNQDTALLFCIECIKNILTVDNTNAGVKELDIERVARIFIMLADASVIPFKSNPSTGNLNWTSLLLPAISTLQDALKRPYMDDKKFLSALKLIILLLKESDGCNKSKTLHSVTIIRLLRDHPDWVQYMHKSFFASVNSNYISTNAVLYEAFQVLSAKMELKALFVEVALKFPTTISNLLDNTSSKRELLLPMWRIWNTILFNLFYSEDKLSVSDLNLASFNQLNQRVVSIIIKENILSESLFRPSFVEETEKVQWLQFSHKMLCDVWDVISVVIKQFKPNDLEDLVLPLVEEAQRTFNSGPKMVVPHVISCLTSILPILSLNNLSQVLDCSWNACLEIRGNEAFRPALNSLIEAIFQEDMLKKDFFSILHQYIMKFEKLSESTSGIFCSVIKQFCKVYSMISLEKSGFYFVPLFVSALTYGPIHLKAHKIMEETLVYLIEHDSSLAESLTLFDNNKPSYFVRIEAINYLSKSVCLDLKCKEELIFDLVESLLTVDGSSADGVRSSQFANSFSHRLKNRAWQAILFLLHGIESENLKEKIFLETLRNIGSENQQPSIRYIQEWAIFNLCSSNKLVNLFVSLFEQSLEKRPGYLISVISILNLLVLHKVLKEENQLVRCFKLLTVLCMAQNFTVRLYAQLTLTNLCALCKNLNVASRILQYEFVTQITEMQSSLAEQGNFFKNVHKLASDFYFSTFDPIHHFTLETLFYELPRLSNLSPDEWIKPSLFGKCNNYLPIYNSEASLKTSIPTSWSNKSNVDAGISDNSSLDYNFQKKIIPVKDMIGVDEGFNLVDRNENESARHGLIVVASLIDRIPNLGGLCRTCEIFGVSEFVIGSLRYTEDKTFQNLAVSADKWVRIKEVKPINLKEYLTSMKEEGYTLVGAEQTEDSHILTEYHFPKKSVLLLGHEKEGLPVDLIQLLDTCVEIPQQGVIRSLNVHVSGAILIWEYARQHSKSS